ncbi:MAG: Gfo/Idh/MocA family oxidoreductase [Planctomycetaceae bacterium]|jgi:predicted dehydrogenase|nr:Gfo/Idh/MocA family oxidoreductase [Planctomycetaceae bacterium]
MMSDTKQTSRRNFLKTSGAITAGVAAAANLGIARSAHAAGSDVIKIALVGCGGRANGAIQDRLQVGDNVMVVAIADAYEGRTKGAANMLREEKFKGKVDLPDDRIFVGLDAYKKAIDCLSPGDEVVTATPPGFRPYHYRYAVEKGMHVFMEKPLFTDVAGYRIVMAANKVAEEKNLKICVGLQRRVEPHYKNWAEKVHSGAIGDVQYTRVYWNGGGIWCRQRGAGQSELDFQVNNWYHFVWLCGDNICEQHVHNLDVGNWLHSKGDRMAHPIEANAQGGRTFKAGPEKLMAEAPSFTNDRKAWDEWYQKNKKAFFRHGQAWDHFSVEFTYADGSKMFSQCRHIANTWDQVSEYVVGTNGYGAPGWLRDGKKERLWDNKEKAVKGPFQWEHDKHVDAIRNDKPYHDGWHGAQATMCAVLGREAAFSGKVVKWDDLVEKGRIYSPEQEITNWDQLPPVKADDNGFYESTVAVQGQYNPFV